MISETSVVKSDIIRRISWLRAPLMASLLLASPQSIKFLGKMSDHPLCIYMCHSFASLCPSSVCKVEGREAFDFLVTINYWWLENQYLGWNQRLFWPLLVFYWWASASKKLAALIGKPISWTVSPDIQTSRIIQRDFLYHLDLMTAGIVTIACLLLIANSKSDQQGVDRKNQYLGWYLQTSQIIRKDFLYHLDLMKAGTIVPLLLFY